MMRECNATRPCHTKRPIISINGYHKKETRQRKRKIDFSFFFSLSLATDTTAVANQHSIIVFFFVLIFHWCKKKRVDSIDECIDIQYTEQTLHLIDKSIIYIQYIFIQIKSFFIQNFFFHSLIININIMFSINIYILDVLMKSE